MMMYDAAHSHKSVVTAAKYVTLERARTAGGAQAAASPLCGGIFVAQHLFCYCCARRCVASRQPRNVRICCGGGTHARIAPLANVVKSCVSCASKGETRHARRIDASTKLPTAATAAFSHTLRLPLLAS